MSSISIKPPSFEMVKCDSCVNQVPLALAFHVEDGRRRHMLACSMRCAVDIAGKLHDILDAERAGPGPDQEECPHPLDAIKWNPFNHVTQCHVCGEVMSAGHDDPLPEYKNEQQ